MIKDNHPEFIVIHHSWSLDNPKWNDWEGIRKYHMSYRHNGVIITQDHAKKLAGSGVKTGLEWPWENVGYHYGLEHVNGAIVIQKGRDELRHGAHCSEQKMNFRSIGICVVGNYDNQPPNDVIMRHLAELCANICKRYDMPATSVRPHRDYATYKSCPGNKFSMSDLISKIKVLGVTG
jgi:N-acetyl-anhydromuramyl-L-alanine amidase AmpD